jgi:hypothetical protein
MNTLKNIFFAAILVLASYNSHAQTVKNNTINITNFTADEKANKLFIKWSTDGAIPTNYFEVQRSDDGSTFKTVALVLGPDPAQTGDSYEYAEKINDKTKKHIYFRLCHVNTNGTEQLTKIIEI